MSTGGNQDILALALGKSDKSGRVIGVGKFVTPTSYFTAARHNQNVEEAKKFIQEKLEWEEQRRELESNQNQLTNKIAAFEALVKSRTGQPASKSEKGSCSGKLKVVEDDTVEDEVDVEQSDKKKEVISCII